MTLAEAPPRRVARPRLDFRQLQAQNRRRSLVLAVCLVLLLASLGTAIGALFGQWWIGLLAGTAVAIVQYVVAHRAGSALIMAATGAHPVDRHEDPQLVNVVEELAIAAGLPCPTVYVIDSASPNAFATGFTPQEAAVAVTTGLRSKLRRDELQAVMAHELGHIRNGDTGYMVLMAVLVGSIALLADIGLRALWHQNAVADKKRSAAAVLIVVVVVLGILAPIFSRLLQAAVSRQREFLADATSVELTRHPAALVSALEKLTSDPTPLEGANRATQHLYIVNPMRRARRGGGALSTHPPLRERVRRLRQLFG